jgi:multidrug efflux pump subunit AcrA (membrane-fusion protein)
MMNRNTVWNVTRWAIAAAMTPVVVGCDSNAKPAPPPPPKVSVIEVKPRPVTVYDEYVGQTQAPGTIEIRSQATGLLERQAFIDGAHVNKGELLYVIDQRPFQAQLEQALASLAQAEANLLNARQTLARNAKLIAQKAVSQQDYDGAKLRLRPILMTSFAFILGSVPLAIASGAGAGARQALGTGVVFGMLAATLVGVFFIPVFYVLLQRLSERQWPFGRAGADSASGAGRGPGAAGAGPTASLVD